MSGALGASGGRSQMPAALSAGIGVISENQEIEFTLYRRLVLPVDGYVFWVKSGLSLPSANPNVPLGNLVTPNKPLTAGTTETFRARGSLHYMTAASQDEDDSSGLNSVVFTSLVQVENLNAVAPDTMWLGEWQGVRFSFSRRDMYYEQARLHHYAGSAILSLMASQLIDTPEAWSQMAVVSNSLPVWLAMREPIFPLVGLSGINVPVYPSFLIDQNVVPPYIGIHIFPEATEAVQSAPRFDVNGSQWQLAQDRVRVTLYGFRHEDALAFIDYVQRFCMFTETMGISNMPIARDEKKTQVEFGVLAMKKTIEFQVNYYQAAMRRLAVQLILSASITLDPRPPIPRDPAIWNEFKWNDGATWQ
jgi:hypothetical protein